MRRIATHGRESGFTLLELMIGMAIFIVLSIALVTLLHRSFDFLGSGSEAGEESDLVHVFDRQFTEDLRSVFAVPRTPETMPDVRMLCRRVTWTIETDEATAGGAKETDVQVLLLAFVRSISGEERDRVMRQAGSKAGGTEYIDMHEDERQAREGSLRPPGGLMEVLYAAVPTKGTGGELWSIFRAIRTPIGGKGSLLELADIKDHQALEDRHAVEILSGVLHFDLRFWAHSTTSWEPEITPGAATGRALVTWDSTRGLLDGTGTNGFSLAVGPESLADPRDDVFPRRVRARVVVAPNGGLRYARLVRELPGREATTAESSRKDARGLVSDQVVQLDAPSIVPPSVPEGERYLRVGPELVEYVERRDDEFPVMSRAVGGTPLLTHPKGSRVTFGRTWEFTVAIPSFRLETIR
jgi:hypothetical protein